MRARHKRSRPTTALLAAVLSSIAMNVPADPERIEDEIEAWRAKRPDAAVVPASDPTYRRACGGCHFPYQPGLLPAHAWEQLLSGLPSHFGEDAQLTQAELAPVRNYLLDNAAGRALDRISLALLGSLAPHRIPSRITEVPYFVDAHRELSPDAVRDHPAVRSFAHCDACHTRAAAGSYAKAEVRIPTSAPVTK